MSVSIRRRLPWLILLLAVGGAAWMLIGRAGVLDDLGFVERDGAESAEAADAHDEAAWDEAWDEAPRLVGRASARAGDGYVRADAAGPAASQAPGGPSSSSLVPAHVRWGSRSVNPP